MQQAPEIIGADEASGILGIDRSTLVRWVAAGKITPLQKLPSEKGAWLFARAEVERFRGERDQAKATAS